MAVPAGFELFAMVLENGLSPECCCHPIGAEGVGDSDAGCVESGALGRQNMCGNASRLV
jgi:hypothetical protein